MIDKNAVTCVACHHTEHTFVANIGAETPTPTLPLQGRGQRTMMRCNHCGLIFVVPLWTDSIATNVFANYDGWPGGISGGAADRQESMRFIAQQIISQKPTGGRLLDVGCANGAFFEVMRHQSQPKTAWQFYGAEPDPKWQGLAYPDVKITPQPLRQCHFPNDFFDVITILDALYYIPEPDKELAEIARILKPNGLFVFDVPGQVYLRLRGGIGCMLGLQRTRPFTTYPFYFSRQSLNFLLEQAGLEIIEVAVGRGARQPEPMVRLLVSAYINLAKIMSKLFRNLPPLIAPMPVYNVKRKM